MLGYDEENSEWGSWTDNSMTNFEGVLFFTRQGPLAYKNDL
jgi:hypothetical protein